MSGVLKLIIRCTKRHVLANNISIVRNGTRQHSYSLYSTRNHVQTRSCYNQFVPPKCWKCGTDRKDKSELFCGECKVIQSPGQVTSYFTVFGVNERYGIDQKALTQKYREMQTLLHPDKFSSKSAEEQKISEEFSSLVNKAYNILQSPLARAIHLLNLKGGNIDEDQKVDDPAFLVEIMELNEEVESAETPEELKKLNTKNKKMLEQAVNNIDECFSNGDIECAKREIIKMKYYNSIGLRLNSILREKGVVD